MEKALLKLLESLNDYTILGVGDPSNIIITSLNNDSRKVKRGTLFFALPGTHVSGNNFIKAAIDKGASAVIFSGDYDCATLKKDVALIKVNNARDALWRVSCSFFDNPSHKLITIGVTGTEGKSSTVSFIWQLLRLCNKKAGFISTVEYSLGDDAIPNSEHQTTPESFIVEEMLFKMLQNGCEYAVVESSSHGLSKRLMRLSGVAFDVAVFMNVTEEHLEFHKTFDQYRFDKANLFRALDENCNKKSPPVTNNTLIKHCDGTLDKKKAADNPFNNPLPINKDKNDPCGSAIIPFGVVNALDPSANYFIEATKAPCYAFTTGDENTNCKAKELFPIKNITDDTNLSFTLGDTPITTKLAGSFNAMNVSAALITVSKLLGVTFGDLSNLTDSIKAIKGRMERVNCGQDFTVIVDYAHTPSSFMAIMPSIRENCKGRVIALFGSGGERDKVKRPIQGEIAAKYCDIVILTDEDPRGEDSATLLEEIAAGAKKAGKVLGQDLFIICDRPQAIESAFKMARPLDTVLLLGKSHENSIIYKDHTMPYDEIATAKSLLKSILNK